MNENMESKQKTPLKWLRMLFYFQAAIVAVSLLSYLPISDGWTTWASRAMTVGVIVCLIQLGSANGRYRKAALFRMVYLCVKMFVSLVLSVVFLLLNQFEITNTISWIVLSVAWILSILAVYQEYRGHADMTAALAPKLSGNWRILFICNLVFSILGSCVSFVAAQLYQVLNLSTAAVNTAATIIQAGNLVFRLIYLWFLHRMIRLFRNVH